MMREKQKTTLTQHLFNEQSYIKMQKKRQIDVFKFAITCFHCTAILILIYININYKHIMIFCYIIKKSLFHLSLDSQFFFYLSRSLYSEPKLAFLWATHSFNAGVCVGANRGNRHLRRGRGLGLSK